MEMLTRTPLEGGGRRRTRRPNHHARTPASASASQPMTMPPPTSPVISSPTMFRNATGGVNTYSSTHSIRRASAEARSPARRSAATPAASAPAMVRTTQCTPPRLGGCVRNHLARAALPGVPLLDQPLRQRRGPSDVVALRMVDAHLGEQLERRLVADHLGHGALAQPARDVHHGLDDELVRAVVHA